MGLAAAVTTPVVAAAGEGTRAVTRSGQIDFGMDREEYIAQARAAMQGDPVVSAQIGAIRDAKLDDRASLAEAAGVLVFNLRGSRGTGRLTARFVTVDEHRERLGAGTLVMRNGQTHDIAGDDGLDDLGLGSMLDVGLGLFATQAREAVQRYPQTAEVLGRIERFDLDRSASMAATGMEAFVFDVVGSKASGRIEADFITVDADTERLGKGVLILSDGRRIAFDGEAPFEGERARSSNPFFDQARTAVQRYPETARHLGEIESFTYDSEASMAAPGMLTFVFDVVGSKASGTVSADFITVDADTERLGKGTLTLANGQTIAFDGEPPMPGEQPSPGFSGANPFTEQAQAAVQRYPDTARHLGQIESFTLDSDATASAPGRLTFVFDVVGSKASGTVSADFITVDADTERLGKGTLTLANGQTIAFDGEPPMPGEQQSGSDFVVPDDSPFVLQAREAVERYPLTANALGSITTFKIDSPASMDAPGGETFVFDVVGSKASGRIVADFITVDADTERLGEGTLTLADGREIAFDGEAPFPQESVAEAMPASFAPQDGIFVQQAITALRAHPQVRRHVGDVREATIDREASWSMPGNQYAFDLVGSKGNARLEADLITVDADSERIGAGTLILANGRRISFEDR